MEHEDEGREQEPATADFEKQVLFSSRSTTVETDPVFGIVVKGFMRATVVNGDVCMVPVP